MGQAGRSTTDSQARYHDGILKARSTLAIAAVAIAALITPSPRAQTPATGSRLTVVGPGPNRQLPTVMKSGHEMVALDDLNALLGLSQQEDKMTGGLTVSYKGKNITLTNGQALASVQGRLISMPAPVTKDNGWYVPVEFINRAVALIYDAKIDVRAGSRLLVIGDLRVPKVVARHEPGPWDRVTLQIAPKVAYNLKQEGTKLVLRLEADAVDLSVPVPPTGQTTTAIRTGEGSSIVIDTGPQFGSFRSSELPTETNATLVQIEISTNATAGVSDPAKAAPGTPAAPDAAPPMPDLTPEIAIRSIVIDPGHGGDEIGARGPGGALEKTVTLQTARRLKAAIEARLGIRALLTRDGDQTVRLDERASLANNNKADLFISLHANASVRPSVAGAEVFSLNLAEYGADAEQLAASEATRLPVFGGGTRPIELIRWDMAQARHTKDSGAWATFVLDELRNRVPIAERPIIRAPFRVLVGANMPAVLVEMGFITNPDQEKQLASDAFQNALVAALVQSIVRFRGYLDAGREGATPAGIASLPVTGGERPVQGRQP